MRHLARRSLLTAFATLGMLVGCDDETSATSGTASQPWLDPSSSNVRLTANEVRDHYLKADPATDLKAALAKGDRRFICVMGYATSYPGVEDRKLIDQHGAWTFPYVTDVVRDRVLHERAHEYATAYNKLLASRLNDETP